ncbi:MAG: histidine phosphatase family protein [Solirubrobacteraceae bacterium]
MSDLKLYFVRHGESVANASDRTGVKRPEDADRLSELGWEQARGLGRRLQDEGLEVIVASTMRRAQETAAGIAEVLELPVETDPDLHEVRQSDAFYASSPEYGETGTLNWMPTAPPDFAEPGAESFAEIMGRVHRVRERLSERAAQERILAVSHFGFLHFFLGAALFGEDFSPRLVPGLYQAGHANTGITIFERRARRVMDGIDFPGWVLTTWNDQGHL